jgi:nucleoside 2-deoxyribosyltransferase
MVCGSMAFARQMKEAKRELEKMGHKAIVPTDMEMCIKNPNHIDDLDADFRHCVENEIMKKHFGFIEQSDAILVLNNKKNGVDGYIGTATLMELGVAHHLGKKIFLLHDIPQPKDARWAHEVRILQPVVLNGDLAKIR